MSARRSRSFFLWLVAASALVFSALNCLGESVESLPAKPSDYVSDYAHVLSPETIARLDRLCSQLDHTAANTQIAIVTVHNLDGDDKADFANRLEEKWKVGKKGSDRSVLMLVSVEDRHYWNEVGYGLEGILPDAKVGDIGRLMVPDLKQGNYDEAITTGLVQIANVVAADAKVTLTDSPETRAERAPRPAHVGLSILFRILIVILILLFLLFRFFGRFFFGGWGGGPWIGGGWGGGYGGGGYSGGGDGGGNSESGGDSGFGGFGGGESGGGGAGGDY